MIRSLSKVIARRSSGLLRPYRVASWLGTRPNTENVGKPGLLALVTASGAGDMSAQVAAFHIARPQALFAGRIPALDDKAGLIGARLMADGKAAGIAAQRARHDYRRCRWGE